MDGELLTRLDDVHALVDRQRQLLDELRAASRAARRHHREAQAQVSAAMDNAVATWLRRTGTPGAAPPVPSYLPEGLRP